ncbi:MAG TPA: alpha/beta hydrolase [Casimicrobiaceae bacterium]|jgi:pimeloyl-ACP methyl ester carboxylesterase
MRVRVGPYDVYAYTGSRQPQATAPNLLFIHGAANDHGVFALQSRYFAYHNYNVYALDLPGHGHSDGGALTSVEALADWLIAVLDSLNIAKASLVGHSLGSLIALEAAARDSKRIEKIALLATAVPMKVSAELLAAAAANDHVALEMINSWSFSTARQLGGNQWPGVWMTANAMRLMERMRPNVLHADLSACHGYVNGLKAAATVRCPALALLGGRDLMAPPRAARDLTKTLADARVTTLAECGHAMMSEEPDAVLDALRRFLE